MKCRHCDKEIPEGQGECLPFCSKRCRMIDLGNWASGQYAIPGDPAIDQGFSEEQHEEEGDRGE